mmetsp:Transcript_13125/g.40404  ORF Transcript_13125/g.40404 Transcript_13125/m.40404 type:complete len:806 (-) Transcript_13125:89-2506(-)
MGGLFGLFGEKNGGKGDVEASRPQGRGLSSGADDVRRRLLSDPTGVSYESTDLKYFTRNVMGVNVEKPPTMDPERALNIQHNAQISHKRQLSHRYFRQRLHTKSHKEGADFAGDFKVIDRMNEDTRFLQREVKDQSSMRELLIVMYVVLTATGVITGIVGGMLDTAVEFLTSLRWGVCSRALYLTKEMCCVSTGTEECHDFVPWRHFLGNDVADFVPYIALACLYGVTSAWLVKTFAPYAAGSGIPEIKAVLNGTVMKGYLSAWTLVIKITGLTLSVASGLNLGKEGPVVHLASCIGFLLATRFRLFRYNQSSIRDILSCACAAGVATAFGAPIGGILFALEEASTFFPNHVLWRAFYCAAAAALVLKMYNPFFNGRLVMFEVEGVVNWHWFELIPIAFIGIAGGFIGHLWIKLNLRWMKTKLRSSFWKRSPILETFILVALTVCANWVFPFLRETNSLVLTSLFRGCMADEVVRSGEWFPLLCDPARRWELVITLAYGAVQKFILSALTFGSRVPAGLFIPSLTIGAIFGTIVGIGVHVLALTLPHLFIFRECTSSTYCAAGSVYAIVGAASVLAGVTQVSVSLAVIMLELTDQLNLLLPLMIAILLAKLVTNSFGTPSIYDSYVHMKRYPFLEPGADFHHALVTAAEVMRTKVMVIPRAGLTVSMLEKIYEETNVSGYPIVTDMDNKLLAGYLSRMELKVALVLAERDPQVQANTPVVFKNERATNEPLLDENGNADFGKFADFFVAQAFDTSPLSKVYALMQETGTRHVIIVRDGKVVGIISKKDLIAFIDVSEDIPRKYFL